MIVKQWITVQLTDSFSVEEGVWEGREEEIQTFVETIPSGTLLVFPAKDFRSRAVVMCPGGGFEQVNMMHEGVDFSAWFRDQSITYAVLKYRLPEGNREIPFEDLSKGIDALRNRIPGIEPEHVGVMGASIGGYLAVTAALTFSGRLRPDFQILLYPVVSMEGGLTHLPSRRRLFGRDLSEPEAARFSYGDRAERFAPPAFIAAAADDRIVTPMNSLLYCEQLVWGDVPVSFHLYSSGGHGFGCKDEFVYKTQFLQELAVWLRNL